MYVQSSGEVPEVFSRYTNLFVVSRGSTGVLGRNFPSPSDEIVSTDVWSCDELRCKVRFKRCLS